MGAEVLETYFSNFDCMYIYIYIYFLILGFGIVSPAGPEPISHCSGRGVLITGLLWEVPVVLTLSPTNGYYLS